jgi:hypothetical protein
MLSRLNEQLSITSCRQSRVVGDEHQSRTKICVKLKQQINYLGPRICIKISRRFVGEQNRGI